MRCLQCYMKELFLNYTFETRSFTAFILITKHNWRLLAEASTTAMKKNLLLFFLAGLTILAKAQEFSADKLMNMLSLTTPKLESQLLSKRYSLSGTELYGDTAVKTFTYRPKKKKLADSVGRKFLRSVLKETFTLTYQTTEITEYTGIIDALKKDGFHCDYEKDSTINPTSYLYQHEDYTADVSIKKIDSTAWYSITFHKKILPVDRDLHYAEDLLEFTSHEYLEYYFGANNVKKDIYYFAGNDIVNCSVLFINTKRQVIFIWKDGLNRRKINNLLFGGQHKLKSQQDYEKFIAENSWLLKSGVHAGMPLFKLRTLNDKNIAFCGGDAANPGLVFPQSSGEVDFKNADIILGCMNCSDDKFLNTKIMYADQAMEEARVLFVLTISLYPVVTGVFE
jgi:hypothetical protein